MFILFLQFLLTTIAYEASVYYASDEVDPKDMLLPEIPRPLSIPFFQSQLRTPTEAAMQSPQPKAYKSEAYISPLVIDLRFNSIMTHLRHPPPLPPRLTNQEPTLPFPNAAPWPLPGMGMLMRVSRQMQDAGTGQGLVATGGATMGRSPR